MNDETLVQASIFESIIDMFEGMGRLISQNAWGAVGYVVIGLIISLLVLLSPPGKKLFKRHELRDIEFFRRRASDLEHQRNAFENERDRVSTQLMQARFESDKLRDEASARVEKANAKNAELASQIVALTLDVTESRNRLEAELKDRERRLKEAFEQLQLTESQKVKVEESLEQIREDVARSNQTNEKLAKEVERIQVDLQDSRRTLQVAQEIAEGIQTDFKRWPLRLPETLLSRETSCKVISIFNFKGGVGKTTVTHFLGHALAQQQRSKVLLIDLDPQGSLTTWAVRGRHLGHCDYLVDLPLLPEETVERRLLATVPTVNGDNLVHLLPAHNENARNLDLRLFMAMASHIEFDPRTFLAQVLDRHRVHEEFDYVLIDCAPNLGIVGINALVASDAYIIPTIPDRMSTNGILSLMEFVEANLRHALTGRPRPLGIIPTRVEKLQQHDSAIKDLKRFAKSVNTTVLPIIPKRVDIPRRMENYMPLAKSDATYFTKLSQVVSRTLSDQEASK